MNRWSGRVTLWAEAGMWWVLWALTSWAGTPAQEAWDVLKSGDAERALAMTEGRFMSDSGLAFVRIEAERELFDPRRAAATCQRLMGLFRRNWADRTQLAKTCGWQFIESRTAPDLAVACFDLALAVDPRDSDALAGRRLASTMKPRPEGRWAAPGGDGSVRARRKRDFKYLGNYLWPESGSVSASGAWTVLPETAPVSVQAREAVRLDLFLRPHELVIASWRGTQRVDGAAPPALSRASTHQLHGGYRLTIFQRTPMQLDGTWVIGKGRDEAALRFRIERVGLGVWSADAAAVASPWGTHAALRLGWNVTFEGLATVDLRVEGQALGDAPRGLALLGIERWVRRVGLRLDGQLGRAVRPVEQRFLLTDLPGIEGAGASLTVQGPLAKRWWVVGKLGAKQLHDLTMDGSQSESATSGTVRLEVRASW